MPKPVKVPKPIQPMGRVPKPMTPYDERTFNDPYPAGPPLERESKIPSFTIFVLGVIVGIILTVAMDTFGRWWGAIQ